MADPELAQRNRILALEHARPDTAATPLPPVSTVAAMIANSHVMLSAASGWAADRHNPVFLAPTDAALGEAGSY
jgi:hypothetical protein